MPIVSRVRRHVSFASIVEGELSGAAKRLCERSLLERLTAEGIVFECLSVGSEHCSFIVSERDGGRIASAMRDLDVAVRLRDRCARVTFTRSLTDAPLPPMVRVLAEFDDDGIDVIFLDSDATSITLLVDEADAHRVEDAVTRLVHARRRDRATLPAGHGLAVAG